MRVGFNRSMLKLLMPPAVRACAGLVLAFGGAVWVFSGATVPGAIAVASGAVMTTAWGGRVRRSAVELTRSGRSLRLTEAGIHVPYGRTGDQGYAVMPWEGCARVIARSFRVPGARIPINYVQFVPHEDSAVEGDLTGRVAQVRARFYRVSPALGLMTWAQPYGHRPGIDGVLEHVRRRCPSLPVDDWREGS